MSEPRETPERITISFTLDLDERTRAEWAAYYDLTDPDPQSIGERLAQDFADNVLQDSEAQGHVAVWPRGAVELSS